MDKQKYLAKKSKKPEEEADIDKVQHELRRKKKCNTRQKDESYEKLNQASRLENDGQGIADDQAD